MPKPGSVNERQQQEERNTEISGLGSGEESHAPGLGLVLQTMGGQPSRGSVWKESDWTHLGEVEAGRSARSLS